MFFWLDWVSFWDEQTTSNDNSDLLFLLLLLYTVAVSCAVVVQIWSKYPLPSLIA